MRVHCMYDIGCRFYIILYGYTSHHKIIMLKCKYVYHVDDDVQNAFFVFTSAWLSM